MAAIEELVRDRFKSLATGTAYTDLVAELDTGLFNTGKMIEAVRDLVLFPANTEIDVDGVAAVTLSLLAYLGQLGLLVDALEHHAIMAEDIDYRKAGDARIVGGTAGPMDRA